MPLSAEEYDKLTKEERETYDKSERARERAEQASQCVSCRIRSHTDPQPRPPPTALPYKWKQELGDLTILVPVPKGTRSKQLNVVIAKKKLVVGVKGQEPILSGELPNEIKVEDSTWTLGAFSDM